MLQEDEQLSLARAAPKYEHLLCTWAGGTKDPLGS